MIKKIITIEELKFVDFDEFKISNKEQLTQKLTVENILFSDYNFTNLFIWGDVYQLKWVEIEEGLLIYDGHRDFLSMVVGLNINSKHLPQIYLKISEQMIKMGKSGNFYLIDPKLVEIHYQELAKNFKISVDQYYSDYLYRCQKLYQLKGHLLSKKKNLISQFSRNNPDYFVREISPEYFHLCNQLTVEWCKSNQNCDEPAFKNEHLAIMKSLAFFKELQLQGLILFINASMAVPLTSTAAPTPTPVAFSIYSRLNHDTANVHFEKANINVKGSAQVINWMTAKHLLDHYQFINREQDLGIAGLRQAKMSYQPERLLHSYTLSRI